MSITHLVLALNNVRKHWIKLQVEISGDHKETQVDSYFLYKHKEKDLEIANHFHSENSTHSCSHKAKMWSPGGSTWGEESWEWQCRPIISAAREAKAQGLGTRGQPAALWDFISKTETNVPGHLPGAPPYFSFCFCPNLYSQAQCSVPAGDLYLRTMCFRLGLSTNSWWILPSS